MRKTIWLYDVTFLIRYPYCSFFYHQQRSQVSITTKKLALELLPSTNGVAKVMFSVVCVCLISPQEGDPVQGSVPPTPDMFKLFHCEARTLGKRAVGILLKCLLACREIAQLTSKAEWEPLFVSSQSQMDE